MSLLANIKRIDFVGPGEVAVVYEINGRTLARRAYVDCSASAFTFRITGFWRPGEAVANEPPQAEPSKAPASRLRGFLAKLGGDA